MEALEEICAKKYDVIIIGAGAAGLFAAACFDAPVNGLIINKAAYPGLKLLMSGNGQCNLTHGGSIKDFIGHYGENGKAVRSVLYKFSNEAVVNFFESHDVPVMERSDGKVFPKSMKAQDICGLLLGLAQKNGFELMNRSSVMDIRPVFDDEQNPKTCSSDCGLAIGCNCGNGYMVKSSDAGRDCTYYCKNLIIAAGGRSYPTTGSDGSIIPVLERLGIELIPQKPALVTVSVQNYPYGELSGISFKNVELIVEAPRKSLVNSDNEDNNKANKSRKCMGDLLFTHENFSGPLILDNSRYIQTGSDISINYLPGKNTSEVSKALKKSTDGGNRKAVTLLLEYCASIDRPLPKRFLEVLLIRLGIEPDYKAKLLTGAQIDQIAGQLMADRFSVSGLGSYNCAMSTAGGIRLQELHANTLELKKYPHLYAIGEILDVDGDTGGYNIQFAFSSAHAAVKAIK